MTKAAEGFLQELCRLLGYGMSVAAAREALVAAGDPVAGKLQGAEAAGVLPARDALALLAAERSGQPAALLADYLALRRYREGFGLADAGRGVALVLMGAWVLLFLGALANEVLEPVILFAIDGYRYEWRPSKLAQLYVDLGSFLALAVALLWLPSLLGGLVLAQPGALRVLRPLLARVPWLRRPLREHEAAVQVQEVGWALAWPEVRTAWRELRVPDLPHWQHLDGDKAPAELLPRGVTRAGRAAHRAVADRDADAAREALTALARAQAAPMPALRMRPTVMVLVLYGALLLVSLGMASHFGQMLETLRLFGY